MGRTEATFKNFIWSFFSTAVSLVLNFVARTALVKTLGATYVGVNGLFSNILGFLSLAELGIGTAIGFSLYKPLADNNIKKIQAYINFYRKAYRIIAAVVSVIGLSLIPFLSVIVKGGENVDHLTIIYIIFLFNSVSSYLITYKSTIISADQKAYKITKINTVVNIITIVFQIISLLIFKNFIVYLLVYAVICLIRNLYVNNYYTIKHYPYLRERNSERISKEERKTIFVKIKALMYHKIGEVVIYQTDSIIISSMINVTAFGYVSNYLMIINVIRNLINLFFSSIPASFGNLIATGDKSSLLRTYKRFNFIGFWASSFSFCSLYFLLTPFVKIWLGENYVIEDKVVLLLVINFYMSVMRIAPHIVRAAAGAYEQDKLSPIIESILNLLVSIFAAYKFGLIGVYLGTFVSAFVPSIWRPIVAYKYVLKEKVVLYFRDYFFYLIITIANSFLIKLITCFVSFNNIYINFCFIVLICLIIPNGVIVLLFHKSDEFIFLIQQIRNVLNKYMYRGKKNV